MSIAGLVVLFNVIFVIRRIHTAGAMPLLGMLASVTIWAFTYSLELASADFNWQYFWLRTEYFGIPNVSTFFFLFALEYTQQTKLLERKWLYSLWVIPIASLILAWTNNLHGLIWSEVGQTDYGAYTMLHLQHGIFFWIMAANSYVMLFSGSIILIRRAITGWATFKYQPLVMIGGVLVTWIGNILYLTGTNPVPELDWTPLSAILSGMIYSVGLLRFGILDIMPIAGESVLESMEDMVFVLNDQNYIVFINKVFEYYTGVDSKTLIGKHAEEALAPWPEIKALAGVENTIHSEVSLNLKNHGLIFFDTRISNIRWKTERLLGRVIRMDDVTERHFAEHRGNLVEQAGSVEIPMIVVFSLKQERIVEVNRKFLIHFGMERTDVIGRSLLELGIWDAYQRAEFQKLILHKDGLQNHSLQLTDGRGTSGAYSVSAQSIELGGERYMALFARRES